ncbi:hypothetical protein SMACR_02098 [Sordaria macrospora]|uniref:WGS project CABT00000000 data, contig 2.18 n=2 Tax=Sordaria macrospora TaxID=5147 RepID=F7W0Z0_SORMK|nr:uncharacterized protein SMAC_02098 [Sordaria macrospora k-hell]KAA8629638.1 hypothetical protein SMACR_02098 [Sordaria macrospora]WPJ63814.1 hypothetical protein SMAC4_02098 [Sordaria macrospora]CCC11442.1 unnamed protein product [Sordaria macrospora k-hell]
MSAATATAGFHHAFVPHLPLKADRHTHLETKIAMPLIVNTDSESDFTTVPESRFGVNKMVAVIGSGISGVCAAAHLLKHGLSVTVFERSDGSGGVWKFDERPPEDPPYVYRPPSYGDQHQIPSDAVYRGSNTDLSRLEVRFAPPSPCYAGLKTNVPTPLMGTALGDWPEGSPESVSHSAALQYIRSLAKRSGLDAVTEFHTRVEDVRKTSEGSKWRITTLTMEKDDGILGARFIQRVRDFDLVVVASGHYNMPRIPQIEGLKEWKDTFSDRVIHSKRYRNPEKYRDQNVLVIGAGVSATDVCKELGKISNKTYQSTRNGRFDLPASVLPPNAVRVAAVERFAPPEAEVEGDEPTLGNNQPIPRSVVLIDGTVLHDIHQVVIATGYIVSYPFLPQLHSDITVDANPDDKLVVTSDGVMTHNLHKDIFYINDPTLAFIGVPYHVATFSLFDFQAQALARVFAGRAKLPTQEDMRKEYEERVESKGRGRFFHSLVTPGHEVTYVKDLAEWVNSHVKEAGGEPMPAHSDEFLEEYEVLKSRIRGLYPEVAKNNGRVQE